MLLQIFARDADDDDGFRRWLAATAIPDSVCPTHKAMSTRLRAAPRRLGRSIRSKHTIPFAPFASRFATTDKW